MISPCNQYIWQHILELLHDMKLAYASQALHPSKRIKWASQPLALWRCLWQMSPSVPGPHLQARAHTALCSIHTSESLPCSCCLVFQTLVTSLQSMINSSIYKLARFTLMSLCHEPCRPQSLSYTVAVTHSLCCTQPLKTAWVPHRCITAVLIDCVIRTARQHSADWTWY